MSAWKPPTPPPRPRADRNLVQGFERIVATIPFVLALTVLAVIAVHPRNVTAGTDQRAAGKRFLADDRGYKAAIDELARLGVFTVRTLPAGKGLPPRETVSFDEAALAAAEKQGVLCRPQTPSLIAQAWDWAASLLRDRKASAASPCRALIEQYRDATYLTQDMLRASQQTWLMRGNTITGMRPQAHALRESGYDPISAQGAITYASGSADPEDNWALVNPASIDFEMQPLERQPNSASCRIPDADASITSYCFREGVVIVLPRERTGQQVYLNGRAVTNPEVEKYDFRRILTLQKGETLAFAPPGQKPARTWQLLERRVDLSQVVDGLRIRDPAFAGLASQIDTTLTSELQSTVDRNLQREIQRVLDKTLESKPAQVGASLRGAVLLMDGLNGQIAAAATFPNKPEHLLARDRGRPERVRWLEQNQAFESLPVGSTAKVPFAGAITTAQPGLLDLVIAQTAPGKYDSRRFLLSGERITGNDFIYGDSRTNVGFNTALVLSDNFYAVSLIRAAWMANRKAPLNAQWLRNIRVLTCGAASYEQADAACPAFLWGDDAEPRRGSPHIGAGFDAKPDKIFNFDAAEIEAAPHTRLFYGPLGNGDFNWSLAQLTQAYARFMSGRAVAMTLAAGKRTTPSLEFFLRQPGYNRSWDAVMRGMRGVIQAGTAKEIKDLEGTLGPGVYLYGKTGTPTLGYKAEADGKLFVLAAVRTSDGLPPEQGGDVEAARGRICAMRFLTINLEVDTSAVPVARELLENNQRVRRWMTAPCPTSKGARK